MLAATSAWGGKGDLDLGLLEVSVLNRDRAAWVVLDARPRAEWQAGHVPGALSFSWEDYTRTDAQGVPYRVWPAQELARALGTLGIDEKTPVVVYGDADKSWGGEGWACWVLAWLGHRGPIRLLNGGVQAWTRRGLPLAAGVETPARLAARYQPAPRPELDVGAADLRRNPAAFSVVDCRGTVERLLGRIPGAVAIPWEEFYEGDERRPLDPAALKKLLRESGVDTARPVVYYCAGGVRSAYAWLVHELAGLPAARNFEGGMEEWKRSP